MTSILAGLWLLSMIGTVIAHLVGGEVVLAIRILVGSFLGLSAGMGTKGVFSFGLYIQGLALGTVAFLAGWLVLPTAIQMGPALRAPSYAWLLVSAVIGFLFGKREDVDPDTWIFKPRE